MTDFHLRSRAGLESLLRLGRFSLLLTQSHPVFPHKTFVPALPSLEYFLYLLSSNQIQTFKA